MDNFKNYAKYYDLLYKDKDYNKESKYIIDKIIKWGGTQQVKTILELGCGTGKHAKLLQSNGYSVYGIDLSANMIKLAKQNGVNCEVADIRTYRQSNKFDCCVSLFHIASYQNSDEDISDYFKTASFHLKQDGIFIFDIWYKPAVLYQLPEKRVKIMENDDIKVIRHCNPEHLPDESIVKVNYEIEIIDKKSNERESIKETHAMRYFSSDEIKRFAKQAKIKIINEEEWLTKNTPSKNTWGVCFVGEKV